jgi:hypothetical protein
VPSHGIVLVGAEFPDSPITRPFLAVLLIALRQDRIADEVRGCIP